METAQIYGCGKHGETEHEPITAPDRRKLAGKLRREGFKKLPGGGWWNRAAQLTAVPNR